MGLYCRSRYKTIRRQSREVFIGGIGVGGEQPVRIQSMCTTNTQDVDATIKQSIALAEAGCEIIRITAPNKKAAAALKDIRAGFRAAGFQQPLVADIHFLPSAAMEAVEHVEKVRVNPGNYADNKKFATREYTDSQYEEEIQRLHEDFSPLVIRSKELGRAMRIGTNHGSLSDRIMNRYGDTPLGMVESALEFLRIAESHSYYDIILSMKASNPKVMIEAYRLLVDRMDDEDMRYPLHLGVTEAGDGEDGRIKSSIGIGSLLLDGLGDTIRVSLTEDPVYEIPVAQSLANKVMKLWGQNNDAPQESDSIDPYQFQRRETTPVELSALCKVDSETPPTVITQSPFDLSQPNEIVAAVKAATPKFRDIQLEGLLIEVKDDSDLANLPRVLQELQGHIQFPILSRKDSHHPLNLKEIPLQGSYGVLQSFHALNAEELPSFLEDCEERKAIPFLNLYPTLPDEVLSLLKNKSIVITLQPSDPTHQSTDNPVGHYRRFTERLRTLGIASPIWIRNTPETAIGHSERFLSKVIESSILTGSLLADGIGDLISIETEPDPARATILSYNVLQGAGSRISKTEFVACPSCGRTLFDLQTTTQRIREKTGHLKGVKIAIMGCIVNGPGEMADADFGYVGGAPAKINLYVGKECVKYNIPQAEADERLIDLIKDHGKWVEAPETAKV